MYNISLFNVSTDDFHFVYSFMSHIQTRFILFTHSALFVSRVVSTIIQ